MLPWKLERNRKKKQQVDIPLVINLLSFSFNRGGAAKAASRFSSIAKKLRTVREISVEGYPSKLQRRVHFLKRIVSYLFVIRYQKTCKVKCSANLFSFNPAIKYFSEAHDLQHIHWINNDTVSIFDLKKIPYGSIITLHDEWLYCGVQHYFDVEKDFVESPYSSQTELGINSFHGLIDKFVWDLKKKSFIGRDDLVVTCPSKWLAARAKTSYILKDCNVRVLYNPVDVDIYVPLSKDEQYKRREQLGIEDRFLLLFGAIGGTKNQIKGYTELVQALEILAKNEAIKKRVAIGLFGASEKGGKLVHDFPVLEFGYVNSEEKMAEIYSLAHATIVPSKLEAFGQIAAESQSCETPTIAFATSGLKDVVIDGETGFLAQPFSPASLAEKIESIILLNTASYKRLCKNARLHVIEHFSNDVISKEYEAIINEQLMKKKGAVE